MVLPEKIKAAIFAGEGKLEIVQRPMPAIKETDDVLIKVEVCGICGTDLRFLSVPPVLTAKPGVILGHEHVGRIVALGAGAKGFQVGDRIAVMPDVPCGYCRTCREGRPNLCENIVSIGGDLDGGFAEYVVHPARTLVKVPDSLPREKAAFIELLSCVSSGVEKAAPLPGENVLIIGAGPAGLTYLKLFRAAGAGQVMMAEISPWRSEFALKAGATRVINPKTEDLPAVVNQLTDGRGADIVVDALGFGLEMAVSCAGRRARIIIFGEDARAKCTIKPVDIQHRELRILGSFIGSFNFPKAIQMLESGVVQVTDLITHQVSLDELPGAIKALAGGQGAKGICLM